MQDWWTYSLSDLLLFSPRTYYRMLQRHNEAHWPAQLLTFSLAIAILGLSRRPSARRGRIMAGILAALWAWIAWAFLWQRYASINWAISYVAPAFVLESLLLFWLAVRGRVSFRRAADMDDAAGMSLFLLALVGYPLLAPVLGRPIQQAESFGLFPDPTAVGTLGLLLLLDRPTLWSLMAIPVCWCVLTGATLWAMGQPDAFVGPAAALVSVIARMRQSRLRGPPADRAPARSG